MRYRNLGGTGLRVSVIGLGTWQYGGEWGRTFSQAQADAILDQAGDLGINLIDTAECYGDHLSERLIGDYLSRHDRALWFVATKFGHHFNRFLDRTEDFSAAGVRQQLEASLQALRIERIDLYQFHSGSDSQALNEDLWTMLAEQKRAGKIRHLGISILGKGSEAQAREARRLGVEALQVIYNRLDRRPEQLYFPHAAQHSLGILARVPLASGLLSGKYRAGVLHRPHAVDREAQRRIRAHLFQQPIEVAVLQFLDFRLVIGKPDVEMVVRHHVDGEFAPGREAHRVHGCAPPESQRYLRRRVGGEFRDGEFEGLLAEPAGRGRGTILCAGDCERERRGPGDSGQRDGDIHEFTQLAVSPHIEIRWRDFDARDRLRQTGVAHQFEGIPFNRRIAVLVRRVIHRCDRQLVLPGAEQGHRHRDPRLGLAVDGRVLPPLSEVRQPPVEVDGAGRTIQVQFEVRHARIAHHGSHVESVDAAGRLLQRKAHNARVRPRPGLEVARAVLAGGPVCRRVRRVGVDHRRRVRLAAMELDRGVVELADAPDRRVGGWESRRGEQRQRDQNQGVCAHRNQSEPAFLFSFKSTPCGYVRNSEDSVETLKTVVGPWQLKRQTSAGSK